MSHAIPATVTSLPTLPAGYRPSEDEAYMNPRQVLYFKHKLETWRAQVVQEAESVSKTIASGPRDVGDDADFAARELENSMSAGTAGRYRALIASIDSALRRIANGSFGYCEETDEEIGIKRLEARPTARLSVDAQERHEHLRRQLAA